MSRNSSTNARRNKRDQREYAAANLPDPRGIQSVSSSKSSRNFTNELKPIQTKNFAQAQYLESIISNQITFGTGSAGTGKTYIAASYAAQELFYKRIDKIIITRPAVTAEEDLGFLPGDLAEKFAPYLLPFAEIFSKTLGKSFYEYALKESIIEPAPIGFLRGRTFDNCILLIDEAQNITIGQMKLILSRVGENCKIVVSGDTGQMDIEGASGLSDAIRRLSSIPGVDVVNFLPQDIVRSKFCKAVILAYE